MPFLDREREFVDFWQKILQMGKKKPSDEKFLYIWPADHPKSAGATE
jgi:hypothetical protein